MSKDFKDQLLTEWKPEFVISSGSLVLDRSDALQSFKGIPSGTICHYYSPQEGSYKTTFALQGLSNIQKLGHKVAFVDAECALMDVNWVKGIGVDTSPDKWGLLIPESGEEACDMVEWLLEQGYKGIVVDSIDAMTPQKQLESEFGDSDIGTHAKLITRFVRRLKNLVVKHNAIVWLINQEKINMTQMGVRGHKPTGGSAIMFYSKFNLEMKRTQSDNQSEGQKTIPLKLGVKRSKLGHSYIDVDTYAVQGTGIDLAGELVQLALDVGLIRKAGAWWRECAELKEDEIVIGQGIDSAREWCFLNQEKILETINASV